MSPPVPTSEVTEAIRRCSRRQALQVFLEPGGVVEVAGDRDDLNLMHREDHRARAAATAELEAGGGDRLERDAAAPEPARDEGRERRLGAQRLDRLDREARVAVDGVGVRRSELVGDATHGAQEGLVAVDGYAHETGDSASQLVQRRLDRRDALEHAALEHPVGELDVEVILERQHHVDARVRGHSRVVEVGVRREHGRIDGKASVVGEDLSDLLCHARIIGSLGAIAQAHLRTSAITIAVA